MNTFIMNVIRFSKNWIGGNRCVVFPTHSFFETLYCKLGVSMDQDKNLISKKVYEFEQTLKISSILSQFLIF